MEFLSHCLCRLRVQPVHYLQPAAVRTFTGAICDRVFSIADNITFFYVLIGEKFLQEIWCNPVQGKTCREEGDKICRNIVSGQRRLTCGVWMKLSHLITFYCRGPEVFRAHPHIYTQTYFLISSHLHLIHFMVPFSSIHINKFLFPTLKKFD